MAEAVEQFTKLLEATKKPIFILFGAEGWCKPCKIVGPIFEELASSNDNIVFVKVDVQLSPDIAIKYNITAMPTLKIVIDKEVKETISGIMDRNKLSNLIKQYDV